MRFWKKKPTMDWKDRKIERQNKHIAWMEERLKDLAKIGETPQLAQGKSPVRKPVIKPVKLDLNQSLDVFTLIDGDGEVLVGLDSQCKSISECWTRYITDQIQMGPLESLESVVTTVVALVLDAQTRGFKVMNQTFYLNVQ